jgi:predicted amidohydrolase
MSDKELVVCVVQLAMRAASESPLDAALRCTALMDRIAAHQHAGGKPTIDLYVLPELAPIGYNEDTFAKYLPKTKELQDMFVEMDHLFAAQAVKLQAHICYGTIGWKLTDNDNNLSFSIRQKVVDDIGTVIAVYDKIHLCDYGDCAETRFFDAGVEPVSFAINGFRFGLIICADM